MENDARAGRPAFARPQGPPPVGPGAERPPSPRRGEGRGVPGRLGGVAAALFILALCIRPWTHSPGQAGFEHAADGRTPDGGEIAGHGVSECVAPRRAPPGEPARATLLRGVVLRSASPGFSAGESRSAAPEPSRTGNGEGTAVKANAPIVTVSMRRLRGGIPDSFALYQNSPNPFNPGTTIRFQLPVATRAVIQVFNVLGREVGTLLDETGTPGSHEVLVDASNVPPGRYFYRLTAGGFTRTRQMIIRK